MTIEVESKEQPLELRQGDHTRLRDLVDEREDLGESQISKLFTGTTILVTGGTGFLGKLLVEKLLRSCPHLTKIYLLGRPKKNKNIATRLEEQFADVLYKKLKEEQPDFVEKVTFIEGDIGHIDLGISEGNRKIIQDEVEIIFHGAATVRFDEPLKRAVEVNVRGTREMLQLARACTKLRAMVHVSTAYSNCLLKEIEEKIYDIALSGDKLIDLIENQDEEFIEKITPELLGEYPNTYVYSKLAAEDIIRRYSKGLPVAVLRPSIITATSKEPLPGWIDNTYASTGVIFGAAMGLFHVLKCNPSAVSDMVPGDMVINAMIAAVWKMARDFPGKHEDARPADLPPPVYNYVSSVQRPLSWGHFGNIMEKNNTDVPTTHAVWRYFLILTPSKLFYNLLAYFFHWIPGYIGDAIASLIGKKPMLIKTYRKINYFSEIIAYFALREWKFKNDNVQRLFAEMCYADKRIFYFDIGRLDWDEYLLDYLKGIRVYLVKDPIVTVAQGRRHYRKLRTLHYTCCAVLCVIIYKLISCVFNFLV